jgi:hypothetical protein
MPPVSWKTCRSWRTGPSGKIFVRNIHGLAQRHGYIGLCRVTACCAPTCASWKEPLAGRSKSTLCCVALILRQSTCFRSTPPASGWDSARHAPRPSGASFGRIPFRGSSSGAAADGEDAECSRALHVALSERPAQMDYFNGLLGIRSAFRQVPIRPAAYSRFNVPFSTNALTQRATCLPSSGSTGCGAR